MAAKKPLDPNRPCPGCGTTDPAAFYWPIDKRYGIPKKRKYCKICATIRERDSQLHRLYGITIGQYNLKLKEQNGICAICGQLPDQQILNVDHNHKTGDIRGLLCNTCNQGLGSFKDDPKLLEKAASYLRKVFIP